MNEPICISKQAKELSKLAKEVKEYYTLQPTFELETELININKKLLRIISLAVELHKEEVEMPF